ncbi:MAG: GntR family transcriptional regulator, partial [Alicyclobacillaceae bacterium]|nr:GntR family transcriptional regulator [Alicyclobacillaceae bacterium]
MLRRRHGVGTFVGAREQISGGLETLISITQWIENHGYRAGTQGTELMRRSLSATEQEVFQHWNISTVGEIHRVRTADGKPVLFSIDIIPDKFAPALADELDNSLLEYLEKQWGQVVIMARTTIDVTIATSEIATKL